MRTRGAMAAGLAVGLVLLTKYNVGLPLVGGMVAVAALEFLRGRRRVALLMLAAAAMAAAVLVAFLSWQVDGWRQFTSFAVNRSNTPGMNMLERFALYGGIFAERYVARPWLAPVVAGLCAYGWWSHRRHPAVVLGALYVAGSLIVLAAHPYVLARNQFASASLVYLGAALGVSVLAARLRTVRLGPARFRRVAAAACVTAGMVVGVAIVATAVPGAARDIGRLYPGADPALRDLSDYVRAQLEREESGATRLVGCFNELGPGWARLLALRSGRGPVVVDFARPAEGGDPAAAIGAWLPRAEPRVVTIVVEEGSPYLTADYRLHNAWKLEYVREIARCPALEKMDERAFGAGIRAVVYRPREPIFDPATQGDPDPAASPPATGPAVHGGVSR
ncbi:MAG: hypothetical protein R6X25_07000 [Candidatus Krumholzibacteriia bacterium]